MDLYDALEGRRAVKHYDPSYVMPDAEIKELLRLALLSPTSFNTQNWRLVAIHDPKLRREIRAVAWDQSQVTDASLLLVLCGDLNAWRKEPHRYLKNSPPEFQEFIIPAIDAYYRDKEQVQRDEVMRSCGIIAQTLMLTAKAMGYDSCPMVGFDFSALGKLINLPDDHVVSMMIAIGKATAPANPHGGRLTVDDILVIDRFK
ncbi:MAG: nitroreductase family protein [Candidatus Hydrogenedentes bacterium]|nr:nitroreductase family protein [Candidatus Hydrogenedentota bacterium]